MSHSVAKQAIPVELLRNICDDRKLQKLIADVWSYGNRGMFEWFNQPPTVSFKYCPRTVAGQFKKDYREDYKSFGDSADSEQFLFEPTKELDRYCTLLEEKLKQIRENDTAIVRRKVYLRTRISEQIHSCLLKELETSAVDIDDSLVDRAIYGDQQIATTWELRYLDTEQVKEIAYVLRGIDMDRLINHFDTSTYDIDDWLEDFQKSSQELKTCFIEAAEREQVMLTTSI